MKIAVITMPATIVRFSEEKNAPMVFPFRWLGSEAKSLAPSATAREKSGRGGGQHEDLRKGDESLQALPFGEEQRHAARVAGEGDEAEQRHRGQIEEVGVAEHPEPAPAGGCARRFGIAGGRQRPELRQLLERHKRLDRAADVDQEGDQRDREADARRRVQPAGIGCLHQIHSPVPRSRARTPAASMTMITSQRTSCAGTRSSRRAPSREPSITPSTAGTTSSGSTAPRWMYTHAAELLMIEMMSPLEPTATFSGAAMSRLSAGTLAKPAPSPNTPPRKPIAPNAAKPPSVRCVFQSMRVPAAGSVNLPSSLSIRARASGSTRPPSAERVLQMTIAMAITSAPSSACSRSAVMLRPTIAPATEQIEPARPSGITSRRLAMPFLRSCGPAASVPARANSRPAPRTKSR